MQRKQWMLPLLLAALLAGCGKTEAVITEPPVTVPETIQTEPEETTPPLMSWEEFEAAPDGTPVHIETYVQNKFTFWNETATVYAQSEDGGCLLYSMNCPEEQYRKLTAGKKLDVEGLKILWEKKPMIIDGHFQVLEGNYKVDPVDLSDMLGSQELRSNLYQLAQFRELTVCTVELKHDTAGDDVFITATHGDMTGTFRLEADLITPDSQLYSDVSALQEGDKVSFTGIVEWTEFLPEILITDME